MPDPSILTELDKLGAVLQRAGEPAITLTLYDRDEKPFSVGLRTGSGYGCDTFGHGHTPSEAFNAALAKKEEKAAEAAIRARHLALAEDRIRAELAALQRREAA